MICIGINNIIVLYTYLVQFSLGSCSVRITTEWKDYAHNNNIIVGTTIYINIYLYYYYYYYYHYDSYYFFVNSTVYRSIRFGIYFGYKLKRVHNIPFVSKPGKVERYTSPPLPAIGIMNCYYVHNLNTTLNNGWLLFN